MTLMLVVVAATVTAAVGFLGVLVGAFVTARREDRRARDAVVRTASEAFLRQVVQLRQSYWLVTRADGDADEIAQEMTKLVQAEQRARYEMDKLRLVVRSTRTQYYARRVLRHSHGLQLVAESATRRAEAKLRCDELCCPPGVLVEHFTWIFIDGVRREMRIKGRGLMDPMTWRLEQRDPGEPGAPDRQDPTPEMVEHCPIHNPAREMRLQQELGLT
jgi:hypothetical protein